MYKPVLLSVLVFSAEDLPIVSKQSSCMLNVQEKMSYYTGSVINHDLSLSSHAKNKSTGDLKKNFNGKNGRDSLSCAGAAEFERQASYPELRLEILYEIEFFSCGK
ncbi:hypothetical protein CX649_02220 [Bacillaceae bacterium ZC4]|jgi:hypothetical protein|uniref:hypothetical protein n=1 Tax=Aeribacillus TaxID=1055323 RepID=UPI0007B4B313|nr:MULTISPECIES: hypothetical protein [Aeribacillus]AXI38565.1 hypothetical protein CX649_02220 [Bacillaceae bacterium ZC4]KZM53339.1 hypothetical protein A3Q35_02660 [Aeribacillus pallidus]MED0716724.1 hypothetical protein [Aeribacillus composti]MED0746052.1 hypothetical protein [Aeribacillus composti]